MNTENKNKPAFPHEDFEYDGGDQYKVIHNGLTKREYFAAMAMQGLLCGHNPMNHLSEQAVAKVSTDMADALLQQLNPSPK